jgi:hypothetical protein
MAQGIDQLVSLFLDSRQAMRPVLARLSKSVNITVKQNVKRASDTLHENDDIDTMYGTLVGKIEVTCEDGAKVLVDWINPFAIFVHALTIRNEP